MRGGLRTAVSRARLQWAHSACCSLVSKKPEMPSMVLAFVERTLCLPCAIRRSCWALDDQKEGMGAFVQKRKPTFTHK